jgi:hypothetical protein
VLEGIGLILIGFAIFALSRPYMEVAGGGGSPPAPPRWASLGHKVRQHTRRSGAVLRVGLGQVIGAAGMIAGLVVILESM